MTEPLGHVVAEVADDWTTDPDALPTSARALER